MLLALTIDGFEDDGRVTNVSYGFSVFSVVLVVATFAQALITFSSPTAQASGAAQALLRLCSGYPHST